MCIFVLYYIYVDMFGFFRSRVVEFILQRKRFLPKGNLKNIDSPANQIRILSIGNVTITIIAIAIGGTNENDTAYGLQKLIRLPVWQKFPFCVNNNSHFDKIFHFSKSVMAFFLLAIHFMMARLIPKVQSYKKNTLFSVRKTKTFQIPTFIFPKISFLICFTPRQTLIISYYHNDSVIETFGIK